MDIIRMDSDFRDIEVLNNDTLDYESSVDVEKCTFEIGNLINGNTLTLGDYFYISGTEYGGRIDSQKIDTRKGTVTSIGRTWRGILGSKIIEPDEGNNYYILTGDLHTIISTVISRISLESLFEVDESETISITYKFYRYIDAYRGIIYMLSDNGYKLSLNWNETSHKVTLKAVPISDYTNERELTSDLFDFTIEKKTASVNHMIGLGSGSLSDRMVVHKYYQADGTIGDTQYYFDEDEITGVFDYPNVESLEELEKSTIDKLKENGVSNSMEIDTNEDLQADIGDKFTANDVVTGISVTEYVTDKIVNIQNNIVKISYEIGEAIK